MNKLDEVAAMNELDAVTDITVEKYIKYRLSHQQDWFEKKSAWNQKWYKRLRIVEVVLAAGIPFASSQMEKFPTAVPIIVSLMAFLIAAISAILALFHFQDNWLQYRTTGEQLKREKFLFLTKSEPYDGEDPFHVLVKNVEEILGEENKSWGEKIKSADSEDIAKQVGQRVKELIAEEMSKQSEGVGGAVSEGTGDDAPPDVFPSRGPASPTSEESASGTQG
jgi:hypothetical protein